MKELLVFMLITGLFILSKPQRSIVHSVVIRKGPLFNETAFDTFKTERQHRIH